jgi:hypothetical protein
LTIFITASEGNKNMRDADNAPFLPDLAVFFGFYASSLVLVGKRLRGGNLFFERENLFEGGAWQTTLSIQRLQSAALLSGGLSSPWPEADQLVSRPVR